MDIEIIDLFGLWELGVGLFGLSELGVGTINKLLKVAARPLTSLSSALSNMRIIAYALVNLLHRHHWYCGFIFIFYFS